MPPNIRLNNSETRVCESGHGHLYCNPLLLHLLLFKTKEQGYENNQAIRRVVTYKMKIYKKYVK